VGEVRQREVIHHTPKFVHYYRSRKEEECTFAFLHWSTSLPCFILQMLWAGAPLSALSASLIIRCLFV